MTKLKLELSQYYEEAQWPMIRHPLVYAVPFFDTPEEAVRLNRMLEQKQAALKKAEAEHHWSTYVFLHERPWRVHAFLQIHAAMVDSVYWPLLREIWVDSENIYANHMDWWELLTVPRSKRRLFMDVEERKAFDKLPESFHVYRGTTAVEREGSYLGFSWTLDKGRAAWFATRFERPGRGGPVLASTEVNKKDCIGLIASRNEEEIVIPNHRTEHIVWEDL